MKGPKTFAFVHQVRDQRILDEFGKRLARKRKEFGLTQEALAEKAGLTLSQIARIETGKVNPTLCTIHRIAEAMNIEPKELF